MRFSFARRPLLVLGTIAVGATVLAGALLVAVKTSETARAEILSSPFFRQFKHTYNSFRKFSDVLFVQHLFSDSALPTYTLVISGDNLARMNEVLPDDPQFGKLFEENKQFVKADFAAPDQGYAARVDVRYRGANANHWNAPKRSYRVRFPEGNFFEGQRLVTFVTPYDRLYYIEPLNAYRAKKLGLIALDMEFVRLNINGADAGVYLMFEHWSPELIEKKEMPTGKLFRIRDASVEIAEDVNDYVNVFDEEDAVKEELAALLALRDHADDAAFAALIPHLLDMEAFYAWSVLNILAGSTHQSEAGNAVLYWNNVTGKFSLVPWDTNFSDALAEPYDDTVSVLARRIFSVPAFRAARDGLLRAYVEDPDNLSDDLAFYDSLAEATRTDFLKDTNKFHTNLRYLALVGEYREWITRNMSAAAAFLETPPTYRPEEIDDAAAFSGSFASLPQVVLPIETFLLRHPQFYRAGPQAVGLSGTVVLPKTIIVPSGTTLVIAPGTTLFMGAGASLVSYGPIVARGTPEAPITIRRLDPKSPWGSVLAVNAPSESVFSYAHVQGGSGVRIHGIDASGMFALHASDVSIDRTLFSASSDDDALNVKWARARVEYSTFIDTASDAIDVDAASPPSLVAHNTFARIGGDAIDLSFSDITLTNNNVRECADKGISIGEVSTVVAEENVIVSCVIGIAVKDLSDALLIRNRLSGNDTGISLYQKKDIFGGATATLEDTIFEGNEENVSVDPGSAVNYE